jgi:hypothetical protein
MFLGTLDQEKVALCSKLQEYWFKDKNSLQESTL